MTNINFDIKSVNETIKTKKGETIYCKEEYAPELYQLYSNLSSNFSNDIMPKVGKIYNAKIIAYGEEILLDMGAKDFIRIDSSRRETIFFANKQIGDNIDVIINKIIETPFTIKGSIASLYEKKAHTDLSVTLEELGWVEATVKYLTSAGYTMEIQYNDAKLAAFMPNTLADANRLADPQSILGKTFTVGIELYSEEEGTYIVSRKRYLESLIPEKIKTLDTEKVYTGTVTAPSKYGVFVQFEECLTGMIHKFNLNPAFQDKIESILPGTEIDFYVKEVVYDKKHQSRIILTQIIRDSLWDTIRPGQIIKGKVHDKMNKEDKFIGFRIKLDYETMGLIHTNELKKFKNPELEIGSEIDIKILDVDKTMRKIYLSLVA